jgi:hypothetical protein
MTTPPTTREREHHCLPRFAQPCPSCGEQLSAPTFCGICGEDVTPTHVCALRPLPHTHAPMPVRAACLQCGQPMPAAQFCTTCGADVTPSHRCPAAPPTHVHRADPLHRCPTLEVERCSRCNTLLPAMTFCADCGVETTQPHHCPPVQIAHVCPPLVIMPRRCSKCGTSMPQSSHCTQCGTDTTPDHLCA